VALKPDQFERLLRHVRKVFGEDVVCPLCGYAEMSAEGLVAHELSQPTVFANVLPSVALVCMHCGNTLFINAVVAGVIPEDDVR
jgi:hypothetical protein